MAAEENRIANLRALVDAEAKAAGGRTKRAGYRAIATATGLKEEYIYQLYTGRKKSLGVDAARSISRAYRGTQPDDWLDHALSQPQVAPNPKKETTVLSRMRAWPFKRVTAQRLDDLKRDLGPEIGAEAISDLDKLLEANVLKWELEVSHRGKRTRG